MDVFFVTNTNVINIFTSSITTDVIARSHGDEAIFFRIASLRVRNDTLFNAFVLVTQLSITCRFNTHCQTIATFVSAT